MAASDNVKEEDPVDVAARAFELERQRRVSERMKSLTQQSQLYQRKIISLQRFVLYNKYKLNVISSDLFLLISIYRALEVAKADLEKAKTELSTAFVSYLSFNYNTF